MQRVFCCCDRCNKEIKNRFTATYHDRNLKLFDYEKNEYDICDDCFESLEKWYESVDTTKMKGEQNDT